VYPLLLVNTWSHEEESHARCHKHQVGHSVRKLRQLRAGVRRSALRSSASAPTRVRLRFLPPPVTRRWRFFMIPIRDRAHPRAGRRFGTPTPV